MILSSIAVVFSNKPITSVLFLVVAFLSSSGLFILLGAELIALSIVIVYVGAVAVLFLFVVMMLGGGAEKVQNRLSLTTVINFCTSSVILFFMIILAHQSLIATSTNDRFAHKSNSESLETNSQNSYDQKITNAHAIGQVLYTDNILVFQISGFILLASMIGSIVLTIRDRKSSKQQHVDNQLNRNPSDAIKIKKVNFKEGLDDIQY
ncbi:MAG: NADH-quinone oxidoreductase subunit J [Rickettsiaceae bacterium]|nr:NADH-quinone oxidoreductase subunit J [Rickettsiaceae bacterium]